jgi:hypothetical protein
MSKDLILLYVFRLHLPCRRDSFITHRAFCDALTEESAKAIGLNASMHAAAPPPHALLFAPPPQQVMQQHQELAAFQQRHQEAMQQQQHCNYAMKTEMPAWSAIPYDHHAQPLLCNAAAAQSYATSAPPPPPQAQASAHMSATALLQKAAQMGATISSAGGGAHYATQMAGAATSAPAGSATFGLPPGHNAQQDGLARSASRGRTDEDGGGAGGGASEGMTRDFLGLRAFSHRDILNLAGFDSCMGVVNANTNITCYEPQQHAQQQQNNNEPWHGMGNHS